MMKMGGENYVTNDDMLTRMSKCDNKPFYGAGSVHYCDHDDVCGHLIRSW